jgi:hypothetical protein
MTADGQRLRTRSALLLGATVALAALGPALVVYDRWLQLRDSSTHLSAYAGRYPFLQNFNLPAYAATIGGAFLLLLVLGAFRASEITKSWTRRCAFARRPRRPTARATQRSRGTAVAALGAGVAALLFLRVALTGRQPGVELLLALCAFAVGMVLREVSFAALRRVWRRSRGTLLSILAAHIAVILALASHYSFHRFELPSLALALAALGNLLARFRRTGPIPLLVLAFVCLYTWRINAWWYALVGDEYRNFELAEKIVTAHDPAFILSHLFQLEGGLEGLDPYADSLVQAAAMRVLGVNSFGWRFSSLYFAAIALAFFHRFFRTFLTRRAALAATVCLGASHYIMSFGKIGYDKFQAYLAMALLLAAAACAIRTRRMIAFVGMGLSAALCFYVYPAALYVVPLPFFLLLVYAPPVDRATLLRWAVAVLAAVLTIFPLPFQQNYFEGKRPGTVFYSPELAHTPATLLGHFGRNVAYAVFSPVVLGSEDHFVTSSYLDPVTGLLYMVGLASAVWLLRRERFLAFLLVSLGWLFFFGGATHDREYPPTTRMFLMLPLFVLLAIAGLERLLALARSAGLSDPAARRVLAATLCAIVVLNVLQTHVVSKRRSDGYELFDPLVLRLATRIEELPPSRRVRLLLLCQSKGEGNGIPQVLGVYDLKEAARQFAEIPLPEGVLTAAERSQVADPARAVFVSPRFAPELRETLEREIASTGKSPCSVRTSTGTERFKLWTSRGVPDLCAP